MNNGEMKMMSNVELDRQIKKITQFLLPKGFLPNGEIITLERAGEIARAIYVNKNWKNLADIDHYTGASYRQTSRDISAWRVLMMILGLGNIYELLTEDRRDYYRPTARCSPGTIKRKIVQTYENYEDTYGDGSVQKKLKRTYKKHGGAGAIEKLLKNDGGPLARITFDEEMYE